MVGAGQDVLEADREIVDEDVEPAGAGGHDHRRLGPPEHALDVPAVGQLDPHERIDPGRTESLDADRASDESLLAAVDREAHQDRDALFFEARRPERRTGLGHDGLDVAARHRE
ncbi:MAG: hypothetical protein R3E53_16025 [Myxococcota bacterium]